MLYIIKNPVENIGSIKNKQAIVTMAVGDWYQNTWEKLFKNSWISYAKKFKLDIIVIQTPLDLEEGIKYITWQKLLILEQPWIQTYEQIIWMDSDIAISSWAENIIEYVRSPSTIGVSFEADQLSLADKHIFLERLINIRIPIQLSETYWNTFVKGYYTEANISTNYDDYSIVNSGVMVLSPKHHRELLSSVYQNRKPGLGQEQPALTHAIKTYKDYSQLSPRFNWCMHPFITLYMNIDVYSKERAYILPEIIKNEFDKSYFLHFNGSKGLIDYLLNSNLITESIFCGNNVSHL